MEQALPGPQKVSLAVTATPFALPPSAHSASGLECGLWRLPRRCSPHATLDKQVVLLPKLARSPFLQAALLTSKEWAGLPSPGSPSPWPAPCVPPGLCHHP